MDDKREYHQDYRLHAFSWQMAHDFVMGTSAVKSCNTTYLPMPAAFERSDAKSPDMTWRGGQTGGDTITKPFKFQYPPWRYYENRAYESYLRRARVPDICDKSLRRLLGLAMRIAPTEKLPPSIEYLGMDATPDGQTLDEFYYAVLREVLLTGRCGIMLDVITDPGRWTLKLFSALSCIDWKTNERNQLSEVCIVEDDWQTDISDDKDNELLTKLYINEAGNAAAMTTRGDVVEVDTEISRMGVGFRGRLPFLFIGPTRISARVDTSPMAGIVDIAQQLYHMEADLAHAEYLTCAPTLILSGFQKDDVEMVGAGAVITTDEPNAKGEYTRTDSDGLTHIRDHMRDLRDEAASAGADLVSEGPRERETAEGARIRHDSGNISLRGTVMKVGQGINYLLKQASDMEGMNDGEPIFEPSVEFLPRALPAAEMQSLLNMYFGGVMSLPTVLENIRRAGLLQDGETVEQELSRIEQSNENMRPDGPGDGMNGNGGGDMNGQM